MERVDLSQAIVKYGTEAVLRYRSVSGIKQDSSLPEIFLGSFIACGIYDELKLHARTEVLYTDIASEHGVELSADLVRVIGGYRADIAVYQEDLPMAVVELKIFNDGKSASSVLADRDKVAKLSKLCRVDTYLGALVTDIESGVLCTTRAQKLGKVLEQKSQVVGASQPSRDGTWKWCFVSGQMQIQSNPSSQETL